VFNDVFCDIRRFCCSDGCFECKINTELICFSNQSRVLTQIGQKLIEL
jgi:hypothetical protein